MQILQIDELLVNVVVKATRDGLAMAGLKPVPCGVNRYFHSHGAVSAIIGFVGQTSGSVMLNASESAACFMAGRMLGEEMKELSSEMLDSFCEITNIIAGQIKAILSNTEHRFERISVPSVVVGTSYYISHYKGMNTMTIDFELPELRTPRLSDTCFSVSMCLMKI